MPRATAPAIATSQLDKLPGAEWICRAFVTLCADFDFIELPMNNDAVRAGEFKLVHKDPFDRVLAAQAVVEGLTLVSKDRWLRELGAETVWG